MIDVRERTSEGLNRARVEIEVRRSAKPLITILIGAIVGLAITYYIAIHVDPAFLQSTYTVKFAVDDATGVQAGSQEMRIKGIPVGVISNVQMDGTRPVITATYRASYGRIYRNAQVVLQPNTPLMDMYLDVVNRGTPSAGVLGPNTPLGASQTNVAVNVDDVLDVFKSDVRERMAQLLYNLGEGLQDHGAQLRAAIVELTPLLQVASRISDQIAERQTITRQLVHDTAVLMSTLAQRDTQLRYLVTEGSSALATLQAGSPDLAATIQQLPPTLTQLDSSFAAVRGVLGDVNGAVTALYPVADDLPPALTALRQLNTVGAPAVNALQRPLQQLVPFSTSLVPVSNDVRRTVSGLLPQMPLVNRATTDLANCKLGIEAFFQDTASLGKLGDLEGSVLRGNLVAGTQTLGIPSPWESSPQACVPGESIGGVLPFPASEH